MFRRLIHRAVDIAEAAAASPVLDPPVDLVTETSRAHVVEAVRRDGTVSIRLISPGMGSSGYYSPDVLEAAGRDRVFPAGTHMYLDHPGASEAVDRPERSLRDLVGVLATDATWQPDHPDGPGLYAEATVYGPWRDVIAEMAPNIGISIRAAAQVSTGTVSGRSARIVDRIVEARSVDYVTQAGRGGRILELLEAAREASLFADDVRARLRSALRDRFVTGDDQWTWVRDFNDTEVIFDLDGAGFDNQGTFRLAYTLDGNEVTLADGDPTEVQPVTTYEPVGEARNWLGYLESRIHLHFTERADDAYGEGRITKPERLALSAGIGAALDAFSAHVEQAAPGLLTRDLWDEPSPPADNPVTESEEDDMTPEQIREAVAQAVQAETADLREAVTTLTTERDEARTTAARATEALVARDARDRVVERLAATDGLPAATVRRLTESLANPASIPTGDDGTLDTAALDEAIDTAVRAELDYLAEAGVSPVRGVGGTTTSTSTPDELAERRERAFRNLGLTEAEAKIAAEGR